MRSVLPLITTDYVLYCADDDFAVPEAIRHITDFLDAHPDHAIAQGHYLTFTPEPGRITFYPRYCLLPGYIRNFDCAITDDSATARMAGEKGMYASMLYGVARTDAFRSAYSYVFDERGEMRFTNLFLAEEFFNHAMLIHGRYDTVPALTWMRRISSAPIDKASVTFKRRVNAFMARHKALALGTRLSEWRYHQKGLRAVAGMPSYPCTFSTPERAALGSPIPRMPP